MANTKATILDSLVTQLSGVSEITTATRNLLLPSDARKKAPYAGVISATEENIVEDSTHVRFELDVSIILLDTGDDIEEMIDAVKDLLYGASIASTIGALQIKIVGQEEVTLVDADRYSSSRIAAVITYVSTKGAF